MIKNYNYLYQKLKQVVSQKLLELNEIELTNNSSAYYINRYKINQVKNLFIIHRIRKDDVTTSYLLSLKEDIDRIRNI